MAHDDSSIADVIKDAVRDARDLVRSEITLAKTEVRGELSRMGMGVALLAGAAMFAGVGLLFLFTTIAWAIAETAGWPVWTGFGIVTVLTLIAAAGLAFAGRSRLTAERHMPRTIDTVKENLQWIKARTS